MTTCCLCHQTFIGCGYNHCLPVFEGNCWENCNRIAVVARHLTREELIESIEELQTIRPGIKELFISYTHSIPDSFLPLWVFMCMKGELI